MSESHSARIVFTNANVFDGVEAIGHSDVVVADGKIASVSPHTGDVVSAPGDTVHDLHGRTLMPGMVSGHGHLSFNGSQIGNPLGVDMTYPPPAMGILAAQNAERTLDAGFTTYVGAGTIHNIDVNLRNLIDEGHIRGPRILPAGRDMGPTGAAIDFKPYFWNIDRTANAFGAICDGPDEFTRAIRAEVKNGARIIKLYPEGGHGLPETARMTPDEIKAAVETAELCGVRVRCHVYSKPVITRCIELGVAIIDHGDHFDAELADMAVEAGVFVLPSLYFARAGAGVYHSDDDVEGWFKHARESLAAGIERGVKYVTGDDFGLKELPHGENAKELALYVNEIGIPPAEVLKWATANGAEMSGFPDVGRIAEGMVADLVVVDGDPLADINVLTDPSRIEMVMKDGKTEKSTLSSPAIALV